MEAWARRLDQIDKASIAQATDPDRRRKDRERVVEQGGQQVLHDGQTPIPQWTNNYREAVLREEHCKPD